MRVADGELTVAQRCACIELSVKIGLAGIQRHRQRQRLEGRSHFIDAGGQTVDAGRIVGFARIVGIVIRHGHHGDDLAGLHIGNETCRSFRLVFVFRLEQFIAQRVFDAKIDCKLDRFLQPISRKTRTMQIGKARTIEPFFHTRDALIVDVHMSDQVRRQRSARIDTLVLAQKPDAGNSEAVDFLLLYRRDFTLQPHEALA